MTFTSITIRKLRALNLDQEIFDAILQIFEEATQKKPKKGDACDREARGTRLSEDWRLPAEWKAYASRVGLTDREISREAEKFKNYWCSLSGPKGLKLKWSSTWSNWCLSMLERAGRVPMLGESAISAGLTPTSFSKETWAAIAKMYKRTGQWNPDFGPGPGRMDCLMPTEFMEADGHGA